MSETAAWSALAREWNAWHAAGRTVTLWLRDDDVRRPGPRLERLLDLIGDAPAGLAAIPDGLEPALADRLSDRPAIRVLQHGFRHLNHAPAGQKKAEFGADRPVREMQAEIRAGWRRIVSMFPDRHAPVFVPPWNRIAPDLAALLPDCGPGLLSVYGARTTEQGKNRVNTHVDIIDWRGSRGFVGTPAAVGGLAGHLERRRSGAVDPDEPTGVLTHQIDHDEDCWQFLATLFARSRAHPAVRWVDPAEPVRASREP